MSKNKIVIAHRGACGYLPEHTLAAKALAYAMGADYLEQDLVMTKDDKLVVLHDHYLDRVTNVATKFPARQRQDGRFYAIDFTLEEIRQLDVTEGYNVSANGCSQANFEGRFPMWQSRFQVNTFEEEIEFIQGLNHTLGQQQKRTVGIYPEIKSPWFHLKEGKDISRATLDVLKKYSYTKKTDPIYLQCFDPNELQRIHTDLMPALKMDLKTIQLISMTDWQETFEEIDGIYQNYSYEWMFTEAGMAKVAKYADGIGPWLPMIVCESSTAKNIKIAPMTHNAKKAGLEIHPYTFRSDEGQIPDYANDFDDLLRIFFNEADVDGVFTDFPDKAVNFLSRQ